MLTLQLRMETTISLELKAQLIGLAKQAVRSNGGGAVMLPVIEQVPPVYLAIGTEDQIQMALKSEHLRRIEVNQKDPVVWNRFAQCAFEADPANAGRGWADATDDELKRYFAIADALAIIVSTHLVD